VPTVTESAVPPHRTVWVSAPVTQPVPAAIVAPGSVSVIVAPVIEARRSFVSPAAM